MQEEYLEPNQTSTEKARILDEKNGSFFAFSTDGSIKLVTVWANV